MHSVIIGDQMQDCPGGGKALGDAPANAPAGPGDHDVAALKVKAHTRSPSARIMRMILRSISP